MGAVSSWVRLLAGRAGGGRMGCRLWTAAHGSVEAVTAVGKICWVSGLRIGWRVG